MNRRLAAAILAIACFVAAAALLWWWRSGRAKPAPPPPPPHAAAGTVPEAGMRQVSLFFPGEGGRLYPERRDLPAPTDPAGQVRAAVSALLTGPQTPGLEAPLPKGVEVGSVVLGEGQVAYVDLRAPERPQPPSSGSLREILTVYSLVDTVTLNVAEARRVVLLWNGVQPESFGGHLDMTHPLAADPGLIAKNP